MVEIKQILVPIDFSTVSRAALKYSIQLAEKWSADVICVNVFYFEETGMESISMVKDKALKDLKWFAETLLEKHNATLKFEAYPGKVQDAIEAISKIKKIDLIVMGTTGGGGIKELIGGSNASNVLFNSKIQVVIIPENYTFSKIKNILLASDLKPLKTNVLDTIKTISKQLGAILNIAHIQQTDYDNDNKLQELHRENLYFGEGVQHKFKNITETNVNKGINYFLDYEDYDLMIMVRREHGFLGNLFKKNHVQDFANDPKIPLLVIHE